MWYVYDVSYLDSAGVLQHKAKNVSAVNNIKTGYLVHK